MVEPNRCPVRLSSMVRVTFLILVLIGVGLAACRDGGQEPNATPSPEEREAVATPVATPSPEERDAVATTVATALVPGLVRPPHLLVTAGASRLAARPPAVGWSGGCADAFAPITSTDILVAEGQPTIVANLQPVPSDNAIESARVTALRIDQQPGCNPREPLSAACGAYLPILDNQDVGWPSASGENIELPFSIQEGGLRVTAALEPGTYVVQLSLYFEGGGNVVYGVLLTLLPSEG